MPITLTVGSDTLNFNNTGDLLSEGTATTLLSFAESIFSGKLTQPVSGFAKGSSAVLSYDGGNNSWTVGNFTFGLTGTVNGAVNLLQGGDVIVKDYTKSFPTTIGTDLTTTANSNNTDSITVPAGSYYVQVSLNLTLTANGAANVTAGAVGITGTGKTNATYLVSFSKLVAGTTSLQDALKQAFEGFVLPLHEETYARLSKFDYLFHQFSATLNLGFGATYGLDKVLFSGQYTADISKTITAPSVGVSGKGEVKAGATFGTTFQYTGNFEATLWKTDDDTGRLHLYKASATDFNLTAGAEVTLIANPSVTVQDGSLATLAQQALPGTTGTVVAALIPQKAQDQADAWTKDVQTTLTNWLKPFQQGKTQLQFAMENTASKFLLTDFTFSLVAADFKDAFGKAIAGDFVGALAVANGGASLDPGCGLEDFHTQKTSVTFNLFGLFNAEWDESKINNYSVLYAGNNTFQLVENIGRTSLSTINKKSQEIDFYFAALASLTAGALKVSEADFYVVLTAKQNAKFGAEIANVLAKGVLGPVPAGLSNQMKAIAGQPSSTVTLELIFKPTAYQNLSFSTYVAGSGLGNAPDDMSNYNNFASACSLTQADLPANFTPGTGIQPMDYALWGTWNIRCNDSEPPENASPNRRHPGNVGEGAVWLGQVYGPKTAVPPTQIGYALGAASDFMNLCEDLKNLQTAIETAPVTWAQLLKDLQNIINNDLPADFVVSSGLALMDCLSNSGTPPQVAGPDPSGSHDATIKVTVTYA